MVRFSTCFLILEMLRSPTSSYDNVDNDNPNLYDQWTEQIEETPTASYEFFGALPLCYAEVEDHGDGPQDLYVGASPPI